jgi:dTDP-4-dehydrorhamnose 3,5-epimerase-like enzyme
MNTLTPDDLGSEFQQAVFTQDYSKKPSIEGVRFIDLRLMVDDGGSFAELVRFNEDGSLEAIPEFKPRQASYSEVLPGAIKAFHLHYGQEDVWFVPPTDQLVIGLVDARKDSSTYQNTMRFVMGSTKAQLLYIPRGVGHGCANLGSKPGHIMYFVNQQFNLSDPDERRLPWDHLGKAFWEITQG